MILSVLRRFSRKAFVLALVLILLGCLPYALRKLAPDAATSLLLPVTLAGALLAWSLAAASFHRGWSLGLLILAGPLLIYAWIAQILPPLFAVYREALRVYPQGGLWYLAHPQIDHSAFLNALPELFARLVPLGLRVSAWLSGTLRGAVVQDPAARAFVWCVVLWGLASWAGWQTHESVRVQRPGLALMALLPATALLGWILDFTSQKSPVFWIHLIALLAALAVANYESLAGLWRRKQMDFSESTWEDTLIATGALAATLLIGAYLAYSISIQDIRDRIREWNEDRTRTAQTTGGPPGKGAGTGTGVGPGVNDIHSVAAGPQLSDDVVMVISTGERPSVPVNIDPNAPFHYWRTMTYQTYLGSGWTNPARAVVQAEPDQPLGAFEADGYKLLRQQVTLNTRADGNLYWSGVLVNADAPLGLLWRAQPNADQPVAAGLGTLLQSDLINATTTAGRYTAESLILQPDEDALRAAQAVYPDWVATRYLQLPDSVPDRVRSLARDLTAGAATPYDRAAAIESYLRQFPYSLEVPAPPRGRDVADYFLFDLETGYCDYFATTMTVLARAAGLPARFVIGYANGSYDSLAAQYVVTQKYAHAWVEIYFPGTGWVEFEPTPSQPAPLRTGTGEIPRYTPGATRSFGWNSRVSGALLDVLDFLWKPAVGLAALYLLWLGSVYLRLNGREPSESIAWLYQRLRRQARSLSGPLPHSQTAHEYAAILSDRFGALQGKNRLTRWLLSQAESPLAVLTGLYAQSLFSPRPVDRAGARAARRAWLDLTWRLGLLNLVLSFPKRNRKA